MHKSQSRLFLLVATAVLLAALLTACVRHNSTRAEPRLPVPRRLLARLSTPAPRPAVAPTTHRRARPLQAARWSELPGWNDDDLAAAWPAFLQSCRALAKRPQWPQWKTVCDEARV
jgi:membrane-bound lytic murein transglycosylase A